MLFGSTHYRGEVWATTNTVTLYTQSCSSVLPPYMMTSTILNTPESNRLDRIEQQKQPIIKEEEVRQQGKSCDSSWFEGFRLSEHLNVFAGYKWIRQVHSLLLLPASLFRKCPPKAQFWKNSSLWCHQGNWYLFQFSDSLPVVCLFFHCLRPTQWRLLFVSFQTGGNKVSVLAGNEK